MVPEGQTEVHHLTTPKLISAGVLPEGARANREGAELLKAFERGVITSDETVSVRLKQSHPRRFSVYVHGKADI